MLALMGSTGPVALTLSGQPRGLTLHYSERRCPLRRGPHAHRHIQSTRLAAAVSVCYGTFTPIYMT